jgi:NADH dehydrogenase
VGAPVAVFGGTGFLGSRIVRQLAGAGWPVRVVARRPAVPDGVDPQRVTLCAADLRDEADVAAAVAGAQAAVNAVSLYVESGALTFRAIHIAGAERLARAAGAGGLGRLVHISGIGSDRASPSAYVAARGEGERRVRAVCPQATVLRPSVLFGPGDAFLAALDALTRLPVVPLFGRGTTRLQPVFVADVAAAVVRALQRPATAGRVFELGGAEVLTYRHALEAVMAHRGRWRPLLPVPFAVWRGLAGALAVLPNPPLTRDQLVLMARDNVVDPALPGFGDLGLGPVGLREKLPACLGEA